MDISIVLITYKRPEKIKRLLDSLFKANIKYTFEIIVVHTKNDCPETFKLLLGYYNSGKIKLIINDKNLGIGPSRNVGMKRAEGKYILILDDDTEVSENAVNAMFEFMEQNSKAGLCGAKLLNADSSLQISARKFPTLYSKIRRRFPMGFEKTIDSYKDYSKSMKVDYVIGACQFIRKEALQKVGYYDEKIFSGPEDVDYCLRMYLKDWEVWYAAEAIIIHHLSQRLKKNFFSKMTLIHVKTLLYYFLKYGTWFKTDICKLKAKT